MQEGAPSWQHTTVLLHEAVQALLPAQEPLTDVSSGVFVDATFGRGGHTRLLLSQLPPTAKVLALDRDPDALAHATQGDQAIHDPRFQIAHAPFSTWGQVVADRGLSPVQGLLMDIGVSSPQIDNPERGFSFRFNAPLDMRMDTTQGESVAQYLARADVDELTHIIHTYGEERFARPVAKAIVARREAGEPLATTFDLAELVARAVKTREAGQNPATRTFQALRIHVNRELDELQDALEAALMHLAPGGRLVVISFHSLEDRIVKTFMNKHSRDVVDRRAPFAPPKPALLTAVSRIKPSDDEVRGNPRARSAVLRVAERTDVPWSAALAGVADVKWKGGRR